MTMKTKREQIRKLLQKCIYKDGDIYVFYSKKAMYKFIDDILALPLEVPSDEDIHRIAYNACMKPSMPNGEPDPDRAYYNAYTHGMIDMREEITKQNK